MHTIFVNQLISVCFKVPIQSNCDMASAENILPGMLSINGW